MRKSLNIFLVTCALFLSSCGKNYNYIYHSVVPESQKYEGSFNIKETAGNNQLDILWIIDNSGSMGSHQKNVATNMDLFMQELSSRNGIDWKMGLVSTDIATKPFIGFDTALTFKTPDYLKLFQSAVLALGTNGSAEEKIFDPGIKWLGQYPNFLRRDALLAVIIVTDTKDQSSSTYKGADFLAKLVALKGGQADMVRIYGAMGAPDFISSTGRVCDSEMYNYKGSEIEYAILNSKGNSFPLCEVDFGVHLSGIANNIAKLLENPSIFLSARPVASSIVVTYKGKALPGGDKDKGGYWYYDYYSNAVVFHDLGFAPTLNEVVKVQFDEDDGWNR